MRHGTRDRVVEDLLSRARDEVLPTAGIVGEVQEALPASAIVTVRMATRFGVGESARSLAKSGGLLTRIAAPGGCDPRRFLHGAAMTLGRPEMDVGGLHLFTFNQVAATEAWRVTQLARLRSFHSSGDRAASAAPGRLA